MAVKLLHEYTTTYRVVADIRMLNTHYQTLMSRYKAILKLQVRNPVLSYAPHEYTTTIMYLADPQCMSTQLLSCI